MKYVLVKYASIEIDKESQIINKISDSLNSYFSDKDYGDGIKEVIIAIICVSKNFEQFFIPKKPKYIKDKKITKSIHTHQTYEIEKCLTYDIKIDFDEFKNASNEKDRERLLAEQILSSLIVFDTMQKKIKDFDLLLFKTDLENYFKEIELI
ncbi:MAG: hypothetical protein ABI576_05120 [Flavobacterium sp.]